MNKEFIQVTKGVVPLSVLALLAIALIAGQGGTDLSFEDRITTVRIAADKPHKKNDLQKGQGSVQSLPVSFDSFNLLATMPTKLDLRRLIPKGAINAEILTNRKLADH